MANCDFRWREPRLPTGGCWNSGGRAGCEIARHVWFRDGHVVLAGPVCAGKSTLARSLARSGRTIVGAATVIEGAAGTRGLSRAELEEWGRRLEAQRPGVWLAEAAANAGGPVVLDAVRTRPQLDAARRFLPHCYAVYLTAPRAVRNARFDLRKASRTSDAAVDFSKLTDSELERAVGALEEHCDISINTAGMTPTAVSAQVSEWLSREA